VGTFCTVHYCWRLFKHKHLTPMAAVPSCRSCRTHYMAITSLKDCCIKQMLRTCMARHFTLKWAATTVRYRWQSPIRCPVLNRGEGTGQRLCLNVCQLVRDVTVEFDMIFHSVLLSYLVCSIANVPNGIEFIVTNTTAEIYGRPLENPFSNFNLKTKYFYNKEEFAGGLP